jgi:hypothetical protein
MWKIVGDFDSPLRVIPFGIPIQISVRLAYLVVLSYCAPSLGTCVKRDPLVSVAEQVAIEAVSNVNSSTDAPLSPTHY